MKARLASAPETSSTPRPQRWNIPFAIRGKVRTAIVVCTVEDVDGGMAVVHTIVRRRLGPRIFGHSHFVLMEWMELRGTLRDSWGERAAIRLWQSLPLGRYPVLDKEKRPYPDLPFVRLARDDDDTNESGQDCS